MYSVAIQGDGMGKKNCYLSLLGYSGRQPVDEKSAYTTIAKGCMSNTDMTFTYIPS